MGDKSVVMAMIFLVKDGGLSDGIRTSPALSNYFEYFRSNKLMSEESPSQVEFRPVDHLYSVWVEGSLVAYTDTIPRNDVYKLGAFFRQPVQIRETPSLGAVLENLIKSCTHDNGVVKTPTQEVVDQAKLLLTQYQTNKPTGE